MTTALAAGTQLVNDALIDAAAAVLGTEDLHAAILDYLDFGWPCRTVTAAALYAASLRDTDTLERLLLDVDLRASNLRDDTTEFHEDLRCFTGDDGYCTVCRDISRERLADALQQLRQHLGDQVLADLAATL